MDPALGLLVVPVAYVWGLGIGPIAIHFSIRKYPGRNVARLNRIMAVSMIAWIALGFAAAHDDFDKLDRSRCAQSAGHTCSDYEYESYKELWSE